MFQNYSETYAAAITTFVGFLIPVLGHFHIVIDQSSATYAVGTILSFAGLIWQFTHRHAQGDVTPLGFKK